MNESAASSELSLDETLRMTASIYLKNALVLFIPFLVSSLVAGILVVLGSSYVVDTPPYLGSSSGEYWSRYWGFLSSAVVFIAAAALVTWLLSGITGGICIKVSSDTIENRKTYFGDSVEIAVRKLGKVFAASLVCSILIALGLFTLVVPGIVIAVMYSLALPSIIVGNTGATDSLSRSKRLVEGRWTKTFMLLLLVYLVILFVSFTAGLLFTVLGPFGWLATSVISAGVGPLLPIMATVHYYSMLARERELYPPPPPF